MSTIVTEPAILTRIDPILTPAVQIPEFLKTIELVASCGSTSSADPLTPMVEELRQLRDEIRDLRQSVDAMKAEIAALVQSPIQATTVTPEFVRGPEPALAEQTLMDIVAVTAELFPGEMGLEVEREPFSTDPPFLVVRVSSTGSSSEIVEKETRWHQRIWHIPGGRELNLRLFIIPL